MIIQDPELDYAGPYKIIQGQKDQAKPWKTTQDNTGPIKTFKTLLDHMQDPICLLRTVKDYTSQGLLSSKWFTQFSVNRNFEN